MSSFQTYHTSVASAQIWRWENMSSKEEEVRNCPNFEFNKRSNLQDQSVYKSNMLAVPRPHAALPQPDADELSTRCGSSMYSGSTSSPCSPDPLANLRSPEIIGKSGSPPPLSEDEEEDPDLAWPDSDDEDGEFLLGSSRVMEQAKVAVDAVARIDTSSADRELARNQAKQAAQATLMSQHFDEQHELECWPSTDDESDQAAMRRNSLALSQNNTVLKKSSSTSFSLSERGSALSGMREMCYQNQTDRVPTAFKIQHTELANVPSKQQQQQQQPWERLGQLEQYTIRVPTPEPSMSRDDDELFSVSSGRLTEKTTDEEHFNLDHTMATLPKDFVLPDEEHRLVAPEVPIQGVLHGFYGLAPRLPAMDPLTRDLTLQGRYLPSQIRLTQDVPIEARTTLLLRNLPNKYTQQGVIELFARCGFPANHVLDFMYVPIDFRSTSNLGYCFINFVCPADAREFMHRFQNFNGWSFNSSKRAEVLWSLPVQGLAGHIDRYRNSPVMHHTVPNEFKPSLWREGMKVRFPRAVQTLEAPKLRRCKKKMNCY